jgi:DNA-binding transcriptional LysR family regulator
VIHLTLRQLKVFEAIARHGSFTRASEELFLTQPTVSMQIKKLTGAIGQPLFEQIGKKIYLTAVGQELYLTCREVFHSLDRFEMTVADMQGLKQGQLRLAVITTAEYFIPRLLGPFCQRYPGIEVTLEVFNREHILQRLNDNMDDLYILGQPPEGIAVEYFPFLENPLVVVGPPGHPLTTLNRVTVQNLAEYPFIMREPGSGTRQALQRLFDEHKVHINVRMELGSNEAIKQAIMGGLGVSALSQHTLTAEVAAGELIILKVQGFPIRRSWYAAYPSGKQLSIIASTFRDYLLNECKQIVGKYFAPAPGQG